MPAPIIQVEYDHLLQVVQRFQAKAEAVVSLRQQLRATVGQLRNDWSGAAATAFFHEFQDEVDPALERLRAALETARDVAMAIHTGMRSAEEAAAALFKGNFGDIAAEAVAAGLGAALGTAVGLRTAPPAPRLGSANLPGGPVFDADGKLIRFDLTLDEFEMLTASERIQWVEALEAHADTPNWFHNIQDIIRYFDESAPLDHMRAGTWASWADAGVLEAMQNGYQLHNLKGVVPAGFNDCGDAAQAWQQFFDREEAGASKTELLPLWAMAEQRGVNYGSDAANLRAGIPAPGTAAAALIPEFVAYGNTYRFIARMQGGGETFVQNYGPWVGQAIGTDVGSGVVTPVANEIDKVVDAIFGPTPTDQKIKDWAGGIGGGIGGGAGDIATMPGMGDWFFDPRSIVEPTGRGPTYFMAKAAESGMIPAMPGMTPIGGRMTLYNGTTIMPNGDAHLVNGTIIGTDGMVTKPGGQRIPIEGTKMNPDGSYTLSDGTIAK